MNRIYFVVALVSLIVVNGLLLGFVFYKTSTNQKVGYVHNDKLIVEFLGYKENQAEYHAMTRLMQSNLDTLSNDFNREVQSYLARKEALSQVQKHKEEENLNQREKELIQYKKAIEQKAQEKEMMMNSSILKQINSMVHDYAVENNYDAIIGVTENGNVLYAKESHDITALLIAYINKKYESK